jgi:phosphatidylglycerol:prolipoprotein diacylglycerol transferase
MLPHHHLYAAAWGAAGLAWVLCGARLLHRRSGGAAPPAALLGLLGGAVVATFAGARLHFLLLSPDLLRDGGFGVLRGGLGDDGAGLRITGGLLAGAAVVLALGPAATGHRLGRAAIADVVVPLAGVAIALGRLGCFADGCCFGVRCAGAWCVRFPASSPAYWSHVAQGLLPPDAHGGSLPVHALQLYLGAAGLLALAASASSLLRRAPDGSRALVFVAVLAALRSAIEPLRESAFGVGVPHEQRLGVAIAVAALLLLAWRVRTAGQRRAPGVLSGS